MSSMQNLSDKDNHLLTQLSYQSHQLSKYEGMTISEIKEYLEYLESQNIEVDKGFKKAINQTAESLGDLKIKASTTDDITGFGAVAFEDPNGNTGISYRGTDGIKKESINDWVDNAVASSGYSIQIQQALDFYEKYSDPNGNNYLYGHSKGGNLAEAVYVENFEKIEGVHLLNPQPLNPYSLTTSQLLAMQDKKVDIVIVEGDYVFWLGNLPSYGNIRVMKNTTGTNAHTFNASRYDENGNFVEADGLLWWQYLGYGVIGGVMTIPQFIAGKFILFAEGIYKIWDFVVNDFIPEAIDFINTVCEYVAQKYEELKEFAAELYKVFVDTVGKISEWIKDKFNKANTAINETLVMVDTKVLRDYAEAVERINNKIKSIDSRLDKFYTKVKITEIYDLLKADVLTGDSWRLRKLKDYFNETASDFDVVERNIKIQL